MLRYRGHIGMRSEADLPLLLLSSVCLPQMSAAFHRHAGALRL